MTECLWTRAGRWLADSTERLQIAEQTPAFGLLGVPAHTTSLSPTNAHLTPGAVRAALNRYSTWSHSQGVDLRDLAAMDLGDIVEPDGTGRREPWRLSGPGRVRYLWPSVATTPSPMR